MDAGDLGSDWSARGAGSTHDDGRLCAGTASATVRRTETPSPPGRPSALLDTPALLRLGYTRSDLERAVERAGGRFEHPDDVRCVIDSFGYLEDWRANYQIRSVRASL